MKAAGSVWPLVQELVKLHGGTVRADSTMGEGSSFSVTIPFGYAHLPADQIGGARTLASTVLGPAPLSKRRSAGCRRSSGRASMTKHDCRRVAWFARASWWSDDNADMRQYVSRLLSERYEVEAAADGQAAFTAVHARDRIWF